MPFLWSNIGKFATPDTLPVSSVEVHVMGSGSNPMVSGHCVTVADTMALTITYSPAFHAVATIEYMAQRFSEHIVALASGSGVMTAGVGAGAGAGAGAAETKADA